MKRYSAFSNTWSNGGRVATLLSLCVYVCFVHDCFHGDHVNQPGAAAGCQRGGVILNSGWNWSCALPLPSSPTPPPRPLPPPLPSTPAMKSPPGCHQLHHLCSMCIRDKIVETLFHNRNNNWIRPQRNKQTTYQPIPVSMVGVATINTLMNI